jgi:topoisomerase IV subunit A
MLDGLAADAVDFRATYDGEEQEPVVLPARFPNLLANGATGIAVGMATSIPPHNAGELCAALLHLIEHPDCATAELVAHVAGPDFPTGGVLVEPPETIEEAYATGRGSFRLRARWRKEPLAHGVYQIVVDQIPYQVPKSRLIEKIAALLDDRKLPLLADMNDESAEDIRIVLEPKTRNVDADVLMEQLFRLTELEVKVPLNLNVIDPAGVPRVMNLKEALQAFLDHRRDVLQRRTRHRLAAVARRMEVLRGFVIVYVNLDEVIRIIREADEPKAEMIARWGLTDAQVEAILNMRLRALRRLEELALRKELDELAGESASLDALLTSDRRQWRALAKEIGETQKEFGSDTELGRRRTLIGAAPEPVEIPVAALVEREPITVLLSQKGWVRAVKGHGSAAEQKYKEGDGPLFAVPAETTDRLIVFGTNGRFYTLAADKLPGGRGQGEPLRLMIDLPNEAELVALFPWRPGLKLLVAADDGRGFVVAGDEALAQTRAGKQVLTPAAGAKATVCVPIGENDDAAALVGDNRRLLVADLAEIPEMARGRGVILQRYRMGGLADAKTLRLADGLSWQQSENRTRSEPDLTPWRGARGGAGRTVPQGFPRTGKFG